MKILVEPLAYDEQNGYLREDGIVGTLTTDGSSPKHNNRVVEPITDNRFFKQAFDTVKENGCEVGDTIDAFNKKVNKSGASPTITTRPEGFKTAVLVYDGFNQKVREDSGVIGTITRNVGADLKRNGQGLIEPRQVDFRVRKLTEKECFRLMGVKDEDFEKVRKNQSKSSCYHLAGDALVSTVMMALFGNMMEIDWREKVNNLTEELANGTSNSFRD